MMLHLPITKLSKFNIIGFLLTILLVIQLFVIPIIPVITNSSSGISPYIAYAYTIFSYLALTVIISLEIKNLHEFHIDHISLWLFVFSCFIRSRLGISNELFYQLLFIVFGVTIIFKTAKNYSSIPRTTKKAAFAGLILACLVLVISTLAEFFQVRNWLNSNYLTSLGLNLLRQSVFQLSFVVLIEEFVFRGFLAGYLIKLGLQEKNAFLIQGLLYWVMHYTRFSDPITFFITLPVLAWSTSFIVYRYKQLTPALIIHMAVNIFIRFFINILM
jgi:membrane protease YdiL (CAAX protease family)